MTDMTIAEGMTRLEAHTRLTVISIWAVIGFAGLMALGQLLEAAGVIDLTVMELSLASLLFAYGYIAYFIALLVSIVFVGVWIYRAHANLRAAGLDYLEFTPGWAIGWFFIPIMNLFKPFEAMRELWNASHGESASYGDPAPRLLTVWWGTYIVGNVLDNIGSRMTANATGNGLVVGLMLGVAGSLLTVVCAWALLTIIREVVNAQREYLSVSYAFA